MVGQFFFCLPGCNYLLGLHWPLLQVMLCRDTLFEGRNSMLSGLLITQMFPATMLLLPLYVMLIQLQLLNTYLGIIVIYTATALPFCVWQMKGYYDTIPVAMEEAARIDGCTPWQTFYKVVFPLAAPALVITALFSFMTAWNEYVIANVVLQDTDMFTLASRA